MSIKYDFREVSHTVQPKYALRTCLVNLNFMISNKKYFILKIVRDATRNGNKVYLQKILQEKGL
jgi:hypothetical protein